MVANSEIDPRARSFKIKEGVKAVTSGAKSYAVGIAAKMYVPGMIERTAKELYLKTGFENIELLREHLENGADLYILLNHQSLGDVGPAVLVAKEVRKRFRRQVKGFRYIMSKTIDNGGQGEETQRYSKAGNRLFKRRKIERINVASTRDQGERSQIQEWKDTRAVVEAIRGEGIATILHPEATMQPGRRDSNSGEICGMVSENPKARKILEHVLSRAKKQGKTCVFLAVGVDGSYRVYDPVTRRVTDEGKRLMRKVDAATILQNPYLFPGPIGTIRVEMPFTNKDLASADPVDEIMLRIAKAVPPHARGIYKDRLRGK